MNYLHLFYCCTVLLLSAAGCTPEERASEPDNRSIYLLSGDDYGFSCSDSRIDSAWVLHPSMCTIIVERFDQHPFRERILQTPRETWISLLRSDSGKLAVSACIWLHFLTGHPIPMTELALLKNRWNPATAKKQVHFWKAYLAKHRIDQP